MASQGSGAPLAPRDPDSAATASTDDTEDPETAQLAAALDPDAAGGPSGPALDDPDAERQRKRAVSQILRRTAQRPITIAEARERLQNDELAPEAIDAAIADAVAIRALDDAAFADAWVHDRGERRGWGAHRLRTELRRRQVPEAQIDQALVALDDRDDEAAAEELARGRMRALPASLEPEKAAKRLVAYLVRRGHAPGLAQRVAIRVSGLDRKWD